MSAVDVRSLITALRQRNWLALDAGQLGLLLSWLGRSEASPELTLLEKDLGKAGSDDALLESAFALLDALLFEADRLREGVAGVGPDRDWDQRRRRFRLLLGVFHPDRYPDHAEWMTSRSQIITRAYGQFKAGKTDPEDAKPERPLQAGPATRVKPQQAAYSGIAPNWRMAEKLRQRLGSDRFLAHKLIGCLMLLVLLSVVSVLLDSESSKSDFEMAAPIYVPAEQWAGADLLLTLDEWPLANPDPDWMTAKQAEVLVSDVYVWGEPDQAPAWLGSAKVAVHGAHSEQKKTPEVITADEPIIANPVFSGHLVVGAEQLDHLQTQAAQEYRPAVETRSLAQTQPSSSRTDAMKARRESRRSSRRESKSEPEPVVTAPAAHLELAQEDVIKPSPAPELQQLHQSAPVSLAESSLVLGPLQNHQAGALLDLYRRSVEQGDINGILETLGRQPRQDGHEGREWFEQRYTELFSNTVQRALSLHILGVRRDGGGWLVDADYHLQTQPANGEQRDQEHQLRYSIMPDPFGLKIVAVETQESRNKAQGSR